MVDQAVIGREDSPELDFVNLGRIQLRGFEIINSAAWPYYM